MKYRTAFIVVIIILVLFNFIFITSSFLKRNEDAYPTPKIQPTTAIYTPKIKPDVANQLKEYINQRNYNKEYCFIINMGLPSGSSRFFIYDLKKNNTSDSGVVTHGRCGQLWMEGRKYSNETGSGCTSLGHYKIGNSYSGKFGLAYKLYGLDSTNSNAFQRYVVLHSHACVPEKEVPTEICQSDGCPTVSPGFLKKLQQKIDASPKPVLLYIYE